MRVKLLRQMLAPLKRYKNDSQYREWLHLSDKIRSVPPETVSVVKAGGFTIRFADASALLNMFENIFTNECYRFPSSKPDPVIIDCGSNIGLSVLWFAKNYPQCSVIAFEPDPFLFGILQQNASVNNIQADLRNEAVWNTGAVLNFSSSKKQNARLSESGTVTVKAIRLKETLQLIPEIDFLKMDIEGAEYAVLNDCMDELHRVKFLFVEFHVRDGNMLDTFSILHRLQNSGFRITVQSPACLSPFLLPRGLQTLEVFASRTSDQ